MRYSEILPRCELVLRSNNIPFILADPGTGKTAMGKLLAEKFNWGFLPEEGSQKDTVDARGLPMIHEGATVITKPDVIAAVEDLFTEGYKEVLVMVDEFTSTIRPVMVGYQQIVLEKRIGRWKFPNPDAVHFMLAGNKSTNRTEYHQMTAPMANRVWFFELDPNVDDLIHWGLKNEKLHEVVVGFLRFRPSLIYTFDAGVYGKANSFSFATPRAWEDVSRALTVGAKADDVAMFSGKLGHGPAAELAAFFKNFGDLDHPKDILRNPKDARVPTKASALYALCGALATYVKSKDQVDPFMVYTTRLQPDFQTVLIQDVIRKGFPLIGNARFSKWLEDHGDFLL